MNKLCIKSRSVAGCRVDDAQMALAALLQRHDTWFVFVMHAAATVTLVLGALLHWVAVCEVEKARCEASKERAKQD